ncbi:MAG: hypothetical protein WC538_08715 [Thermoanaerobaculia bacterium]
MTTSNAPSAHVEDHFDQERIAAREDRVEVDRLQHVAPVASESRRAVVRAQAERVPGERVRAAAQCAPSGRAVQRASAFDVTRADHHVAFAAELEDRRNVAGVMREVGVHRHDAVEARRQRVPEAGEVSGTEAELAGSMDDVNPTGRARCPLIGEPAGAVGRRIVDHDDAQPDRQGEQVGQQEVDVLFLVVRRNDDDGLQVTHQSSLAAHEICRCEKARASEQGRMLPAGFAPGSCLAMPARTVQLHGIRAQCGGGRSSRQAAYRPRATQSSRWRRFA